MTFDNQAAWDAAGHPGEAPSAAKIADAERRIALRDRLLTFRQMAAKQAEHVEPLLGPLVVRGDRTFIVGRTGEGKSTLALSLVRAIMMETEFLGWKGAGGTALVIDVEQGTRTIHRRIGEVWCEGENPYGPEGARLEDLVADMPEMDRSHYWALPEGLGLEADGADREVVREEIERLAPDVVLIDPLYKAFRGNPNEQELAMSVMRTLDAWRATYGFALIIPVHPRKPPPQGAPLTLQDVSGAGAWTWGAEIILGIQRIEGPNHSKLHFFKDRDGDLDTGGKPWILEYDRVEGFRRIATQAPDTTSSADDVRRCLVNAEGEWMSKTQVASIVERTERTVSKVLGAMEAGGEMEVQVLARGRKLYRLRAAVLSEDEELRLIRMAADEGDGDGE